MMNLRKLPTDMNTNRYEKLMQVPPRGAERASSDVVTSEEYRPEDQRRSMTTVAEVCTNFVDKSEPTLSQGSAVVAEEAGTDGTTNVRDRSIDRNTMETTNMQMPMDFLEIPEPTLPRGFLELAEKARNVKIESGQFCYTEEVQSQGTGLTRPVFVTVMEDSSPVLEKGAIRAAGVSSEMIPTRNSAGRRKPVDRSGLVGPQNRTDQPVLTGSDEDQVGTVPTGPVGPDIIIDRIQPVAEGPVGQFSTHSPVGPDHCITSDSDQPTADSGPVYHKQPSGTRSWYNE